MTDTYTHYPQDDEISRDALIEELESRGVPTKIVYHYGEEKKETLIETGVLADEHICYNYFEPKLVVECLGSIKEYNLLDIIHDDFRDEIKNEIEEHIYSMSQGDDRMVDPPQIMRGE